MSSKIELVFEIVLCKTPSELLAYGFKPKGHRHAKLDPTIERPLQNGP
jgi:hypothetical protein